MELKPTGQWRKRVIMGVLAAALVGGPALVFSASAATPEEAIPVEPAWRGGPPSFSELVERVKPAVVNISIIGRPQSAMGRTGPGNPMPSFPEGSPFGEHFRHFFEGLPQGGEAERELRAMGSGFVIDPDGLVVTNNHVIEHADEIEVVLHDGTRLAATVQGRDPKTDLALLRVEVDEALPYVELTDSDHAKVGDWVVAVGNPFGLGGSVTAGIISARGRDIQSGPFDDFLQIDAPINRGNSGGPLFDTQGRVIGINTAIYSPSGGSVGIGFAIPSSMAEGVIAQLASEGSVARGWLGVQIQPVTEEVAESLDLELEQGALVASVLSGSPAERAGLRAGDVIVRMDGEDLSEFKDLPKRVAGTKAGSAVSFEVRRQGKTRQLEVEIGRMPSDGVEVASANAAEGTGAGELGVQLAALTPEARRRYGIAEEIDGALVTGVERGSPAAQAGIRSGSVISMVGQESVASPGDVVDEVKRASKKKRSSVLLLVEQRGEKRFVAVKLTAA